MYGFRTRNVDATQDRVPMPAPVLANAFANATTTTGTARGVRNDADGVHGGAQADDDTDHVFPPSPPLVRPYWPPELHEAVGEANANVGFRASGFRRYGNPPPIVPPFSSGILAALVRAEAGVGEVNPNAGDNTSAGLGSRLRDASARPPNPSRETRFDGISDYASQRARAWESLAAQLSSELSSRQRDNQPSHSAHGEHVATRTEHQEHEYPLQEFPVLWRREDIRGQTFATTRRGLSNLNMGSTAAQNASAPETAAVGTDRRQQARVNVPGAAQPGLPRPQTQTGRPIKTGGATTFVPLRDPWIATGLTENGDNQPERLTRNRAAAAAENGTQAATTFINDGKSTFPTASFSRWAQWTQQPPPSSVTRPYPDPNPRENMTYRTTSRRNPDPENGGPQRTRVFNTFERIPTDERNTDPLPYRNVQFQAEDNLPVSTARDLEVGAENATSSTSIQPVVIVSLESEYPKMPLTDAGFQLAALIKIHAPEIETSLSAENTPSALPTAVDVVCVVDVSGSMSGSKLNYVKNTLKYIVETLSRLDRLSIVSFSMLARLVCPLKLANSENFGYLNGCIESLNAGGGTCMGRGLELALDVMKGRLTENKESAILLLSDGQDNVRVTYENFREKVTAAGYVVLRLLVFRECVWLSFQIPCNLGLVTVVFPLAYSSRIPVFTFGYGADHDASILRRLSEPGGAFTFIENPSVVQDSFAAAMGVLKTVVAKNIKIHARIPSNEIGDIVNAHIVGYQCLISRDRQSFTVDIPNLFRGETRSFLVDLRLKPRTMVVPIMPGLEEDLEILCSHCTYFDTQLQRNVTSPSGSCGGHGAEVDSNTPGGILDDVTLSITASSSSLVVQQRNREVLKEQSRFAVTGVLKKAMNHAERGDITNATSLVVNVWKCVVENMKESFGISDPGLIQRLDYTEVLNTLDGTSPASWVGGGGENATTSTSLDFGTNPPPAPAGASAEDWTFYCALIGDIDSALQKFKNRDTFTASGHAVYAQFSEGFEHNGERILVFFDDVPDSNITAYGALEHASAYIFGWGDRFLWWG
ncbi:hypothetical protein HK102_005397 [Quaeritorhiza haematococci]|nr:hypothetical protein HK102_005397 [Quaeritorhiza haematococci]